MRAFPKILNSSFNFKKLSVVLSDTKKNYVLCFPKNVIQKTNNENHEKCQKDRAVFNIVHIKNVATAAAIIRLFSEKIGVNSFKLILKSNRSSCKLAVGVT